MTKEKSILIRNIYFMLSYAFTVMERKDFKEIETVNYQDALNMFADILNTGISHLIKRGLRHEYVENSDTMPVLRGKLDLNATLREFAMQRRVVSCVFDEFMENQYMNQILKTTMQLLASSKDVKRETRDSLTRLLLYFSEIEAPEPSSIKWGILRYHKNNAVYYLLMNVCYFIHKGFLLSTDRGKIRLASFEDSQAFHDLYEKFLLAFYIKHFRIYQPNASQIKWNTLGNTSLLPKMQSDIMLIDGENKLIIDAKAYSKTMQQNMNSHTVISANLYQIYAYVKNEDKENTGLISGMLLYAKTDEQITPNEEYIISGNRISVKTLDLNTPFEEIKKQLFDIVENWVRNTHNILKESDVNSQVVYT